MRRFLLSLTVVSVLTILWIVGMLAWNVRKFAPSIASAYTLDPSQTVLFLGSSDVGCSIVEAPEFHNRVLWQSSTIPQSCLFRLQALEERGQLEHVKTLVMYFNIHVLRQLKDADIARAYYQEFPMSWGHLDLFPGSRWVLLRHICDNLQYPIDMAVVHQPPKDRPSIVGRGESYYADFCTGVTNRASRVGLTALAKGWRESVLSAIDGIREIARRHHIRFVIVEYPVLACYRASVPADITAANAALLDVFAEKGIEVHRLTHGLPDASYCDADHIIDEAALDYTQNLYKALAL